MHFINKDKSTILFIVLAAIFLANAIIAEFIGVKIFSFEKSVGISPLNLSLFGVNNLSLNLTTGVLLWPIVFVLTDIINEYYGPKGVRFLSIIACILISYSFLIFSLGIKLTPADFWPSSHIHENDANAVQLKSEVSNLNTAFRLIFGQVFG